MLGVVYTSPTAGRCSLCLYVGQSRSSAYYDLNVIEIQADGDELDHILQKFENLPKSNAPVQRWFGDHAKFIFHNWGE